MDAKDLIRLYPKLYHMADADSWPSVQCHGLRSTKALLDLYKVRGIARKQIEAEHRPESVEIHHPVHGTAVIRDQKPLRPIALRACLEGVTETQFYRLLNSQVFFWLSKERLLRLLNARAYRKRAHSIITLDTSELVARYESKIRLSPYNSGATLYNPRPRGRFTFKSIRQYPFDEWRKKRKLSDAIVELTVEYMVRDIEDIALRAEIMKAGTRSRLLWSR